MREGAEPADANARTWLAGLRACALIGAAFSAAAAVEYYGGSQAFCASGGGCDAVRASAIGQGVGQLLPALGMLGFAVLLVATLVRAQWLQLAALSAAATAGIVGVVLLGLQAFALHVFCKICVGADSAGILAGAFAWPLLRRRGPLPSDSARARGAWLAALVLSAGGPLAWAISRPSQAPAFVVALGQHGKLNVVELSDFECPFCRAMHPSLKQALARYGERVHFVRKSYPLPLHRHARTAARAYLCAEQQGRGEAMADRLFAAHDLSQEGCAKQAEAVGLDMPRFAQCVDAPETDQQITRDVELIKHAGMNGLPTVWIGNEALIGYDQAKGAARYTAVLERVAAGRAAPRGRIAWLTVTALAACALFAGSRTRRRPS
jgi:predicted DsbA family dithiol-disulfide isomerase/uncharacterized membrane protein